MGRRNGHTAAPAWRSPAVAITAAMVLALAAPGCGRKDEGRAGAAAASPAACGPCTATLASWAVTPFAPGRHMFVDLDCPGAAARLNGRVEYTSVALREDYESPDDRRLAGRVGRMTLGRHLRPAFHSGDASTVPVRIEETYTITCDQAEVLRADRVFSARYALLGTNSSSGLRRALEAAGMKIPDRILSAGGALGEFPGIDLDPGPEIPRAQWARYGVLAR
ncbi:MAG: hypothetical protein IBJ11_10840 [Phycisphaerales bacterium]|nr:hypothetical protein [Phycisphaerales bacterium]